MIDRQTDFDRAEAALDHLSRLAGLHRAIEDAVSPLLDHAEPDTERMIDALMHAATRETRDAEHLLAQAARACQGRAA